MAQVDAELYTEEIFKAVDTIQTHCEDMIAEIHGNWDTYTFTEQNYFSDMVVDYEQIIIECKNYKYAYNYFFKQKTKDTLYRVKDGDTLITIANDFFGDPSKWEDIYLINNLSDFDISDQETLIIPEIRA